MASRVADVALSVLDGMYVDDMAAVVVSGRRRVIVSV